MRHVQRYSALLSRVHRPLSQVFKQALPPEHCDPSSVGRIRSCTLLPIATAALVCRQHGRSGASLAWLRAFSQSIPESWLLHAEAEQNTADNQVDLVLEQQLDDQSFEVEDVSFREEVYVRTPSEAAAASF